MAMTTTAFSAVDCVIQVDNAGGSLTDVSGSSNKVDLSLTHGVAEFRPFGNQWKGRLVVGKDSTIKIDFVCSTTADEAYDLFKDWFFGGDDSARSIQIDIPDSSVGSDRYTAEVVLEDLDVPLDAGADEVVMGSVTLKPHGAVSHAAIT